MSAGAGTGHIKAAEALALSFAADDRVAEVINSEAIACGLPMCVVSPIHGQEERNSDHLLEEGIAVKCNDLTTLSFKLERLLEAPDRLARMKANALRFAKPTASTTIVDTLLEYRLPPRSFTKDQRAAIALAAGPE